MHHLDQRGLLQKALADVEDFFMSGKCGRSLTMPPLDPWIFADK